MKAVILAAGEGKRMNPLTNTRPKVMLPIGNKPIIEHLVVEARSAGIDEFVFIVGYHDELIRNYFGDGEKWSVKIEYSTQRRQTGTADALRGAAELITGNFLMMNGDVIIIADDIKALSQSRNSTMSLIEVTKTEGLGLVEVNGDDVVRIHEKVKKPPSNLANCGFYFFTSDIFEAIARTPLSKRGEYELTDSIALLIAAGKPVKWHKLTYWLDASYPWDLLIANESILTGMEGDNLGEIEQYAVIKGPVKIGKGTTIRSGSYIMGPVIIGEGCTVGPNCFIRPYTAIGDNCHIGASVEVKNSIIMNNTAVPHHNYVGDSVIGEDCNLGAGTKIANLRLDDANIMIGGINTGRRKLGAILGDRVKTGINSCINLGTMIGNDTFIGPGAIVSGIIAPESKLL